MEMHELLTEMHRQKHLSDYISLQLQLCHPVSQI